MDCPRVETRGTRRRALKYLKSTESEVALIHLGLGDLRTDVFLLVFRLEQHHVGNPKYLRCWKAARSAPFVRLGIHGQRQCRYTRRV